MPPRDQPTARKIASPRARASALKVLANASVARDGESVNTGGDSPVQEALRASSFAGVPLDEIDGILAAADDAGVEALVDELAASLARRLSATPFHEDDFVIRLVVIERRDLYERDVEHTEGAWHVRAELATQPRIVSRWQGLAPLVRCENGDLPIQSAAMVGLCHVEGSPDDQDAVTRSLAFGADDALARIYRLRGHSDRDVAQALETIDLQEAVRGFTEIGAEVARHFGNAHGLGRRVVTQLEVVTASRTYMTQTVADDESTVVHEEPVMTPTVVIRFVSAVDFARICMGETTPIELVAAGKIQVEGDISVFAQVDMLRW
jgi:hypothetical protein